MHDFLLPLINLQKGFSTKYWNFALEGALDTLAGKAYVRVVGHLLEILLTREIQCTFTSFKNTRNL